MFRKSKFIGTDSNYWLPGSEGRGKMGDIEFLEGGMMKKFWDNGGGCTPVYGVYYGVYGVY